MKVGEPSIADAINVLNGIKKYYEAHHGVEVTSQIVSAAVNLSERYISDRFLPDKAIDLLDEACACCNLRHPEISELAETQKSLAALEAEELAQEQAENGPDYERLAQIKTEMAQLREKLPELQLKAGGIKVEMQDVAKVVELWTGIPAMKVEQSEFAKLLNLESELKKRIIGQDEAVEAVARAMKRARADLSGKRRPASFIFVGPTGVGKTELVRQLANQLFDTPDPLIRIDMSEYMEKHTVSRLIGAPPGYVGQLFDEIEKAHPDVMNILLQILDEGRITDSQGRTVNFENTVICMTSNAGSTEKTGETGFAKTPEQISSNKAMKALGEFLRPEFLGRVDEVIVFKPLGEESLERIAALVLDEYVQPLADKGVAFTYTPAACKALVAEAGSKFGARDLRRTIRKRVEDPLAERFVAGTLSSAVTLDAVEGRLELV